MISNSKRLLEGKVALITGAGRGIGAATAEECAKHGAIVYAGDLVEGSVDTVAEELEKKYDTRVIPVCFDVTKEEEAKRVIMQINKEQHQLDILVNNAGVMKDAIIGMITKENMRQIFEVNVFGVITMLQLAAKIMMRKGTGSIINLASIIGTNGNAGQVVYGASKGAVVALTKSAAKELAPKGIRVNAVAPGVIETAMLRSVDDSFVDEYLKNVKMGRVGTPEDVAKVIAFLASDMAGYVTGQIVGIDGGQVI